MPHHRWLIVLSVAMIVAGAITSITAPQLDWLPEGFSRPVLALEFVNSPQDFSHLIDQQDVARQHTRAAASYTRNTWADFGFIAAYATLWMAVLARPRTMIGGTAMAIVAFGALADVVENVGILSGIRAGRAAPSVVSMIHGAATTKWALLGVAFFALGLRFQPNEQLRCGWRLWSAAIGVTYVLAGVLCLIGVTRTPPVIERAVPLLAASTLMQVILFWRARETA